MNTVLVICIGNVARGDDGVAHHVARLLRCSALPAGTRILDAVDLDIAMADDIAASDRLIIVDAERRAQPSVSVEPVEPGPALRPTGHTIDAAALLAVAASLFGSIPHAQLVTVAGPCMGHDEGLSPTAEAASIEAASVILALVRETQTS